MKIIEIKEEVQIGNIILEKGDKIEVLKEGRNDVGTITPHDFRVIVENEVLQVERAEVAHIQFRFIFNNPILELNSSKLSITGSNGTNFMNIYFDSVKSVTYIGNTQLDIQMEDNTIVSMFFIQEIEFSAYEQS